jgi:TPR repeat protein
MTKENNRMRRFLVAVLLIALGCLPAFAQDAAALRAGVVKVMSTVDGKRRTGSGFVVKVDGAAAYVVTAAHVVEGDRNPKVEFFTRQNSPVAAEVIKQELSIDLAVLKIEAAPKPLALALEKTAVPATGDEVIAIGFPQSGGAWLVSKADLAGRDGPYWILSGAAIDQGNSGGPLIKAGKVVGVVQGLQGKFARAMPASVVVETLEGWGIALSSPQASVEDKPSALDTGSASIDYGNFAQVKKAAEGADAKAKYELAEMYSDGKGVAQNFAEAAKWYRRAADAAHPEAEAAMGIISLSKAVGLARDDEAAVRFGSDPAKLSELLAMIFGAADKLQIKDTAELKLAGQWLRKGAEQNVAAAQLILGLMAMNGIGVQQDLTDAAKWLRLAATKSPEAQALMGVLYVYGKGVTQDSGEGVRRLREAAEKGVPLAMTSLGQIYSEGTGVVQDYAEAAKWLRKAVEHNDAKAKALLGVQYLAGQGVPIDLAQAFALLRQSAEAGDVNGQFGLAVMFLTGKGVQQNPAEAVKWLQAAARQGLAEAQQMLQQQGLSW